MDNEKINELKKLIDLEDLKKKKAELELELDRIGDEIGERVSWIKANISWLIVCAACFFSGAVLAGIASMFG